MAEFLKNSSADLFAADRLNQSAVVWNLVIIGEAANKLAPDMKSKFLDIPWERIKGFRNRLVHGYFTLSWEEVWRVASQDVPYLQAEAEKILSVEFPETYRELKNRQA